MQWFDRKWIHSLRQVCRPCRLYFEVLLQQTSRERDLPSTQKILGPSNEKMQTELDKVLRNLGVIASLKQNDKLSTEGDFFTIFVPTAMRSLLRMLYRESREQNLERCAECIRSARIFVTNTISEHGTDAANIHSRSSVNKY